MNGERPLRVLLVSIYEMGRQPFSLASPVAWLRREGCEVRCVDLAVERADRIGAAPADLVAIHLPMHTATRLAIQAAPWIREAQPNAHLCFFGLYAPLNAGLLEEIGARTILGGEFEQGLVALSRWLREGTEASTRPVVSVSLERQRFVRPDRTGLPGLEAYARLVMAPGDLRSVGYTEATRGCKHRCRHCPIVPVYNGRFRVVQEDVVLEDVEQQVAAGAEHLTFGDPDFLNGPRHAVSIVEALHLRFPALTYDVTIKVAHLLRHREYLPTLRDTGCLFVTTAVESLDDRVLGFYEKNHSRADFIEAVRLCRSIGIRLNPTFVAFSPWTSLEGYLEFLDTLEELKLEGDVAPVQYAIRLLITQASRLLELPEVRAIAEPFDRHRLVHPWVHADPRVDQLQRDVLREIREGLHAEASRRRIFEGVQQIARRALGHPVRTINATESPEGARPATTIPYLTEPWYC